MRIKSYFAPSVQSAISLARKEFGDEVTLVTSHAASLEARHLGEYEVVFAVEEPEVVSNAIEPPPSTAPPLFERVLQEAIETPSSTQQALPEKLDQVHGLLIEMGIERAMVRALMTMISRSAGTWVPDFCAAEPATVEPAPGQESGMDERTASETSKDEPAAATDLQLTPAEMAFFLSVSGGA